MVSNLFGNALNMAVVAVCLLSKTTRLQNSQITHLEFQREVTITFLRIKPRKDSVRPGQKPFTSVTLRNTDGR